MRDIGTDLPETERGLAELVMWLLSVDEEVIDGADPDQLAPFDKLRLNAEIGAKRRMVGELLDLEHYSWYGDDYHSCDMLTEPAVWAEVMGPGAPRVCRCGRDLHVKTMLTLLVQCHLREPSWPQ